MLVNAKNEIENRVKVDHHYYPNSNTPSDFDESLFDVTVNEKVTQ